MCRFSYSNNCFTMAVNLVGKLTTHLFVLDLDLGSILRTYSKRFGRFSVFNGVPEKIWKHFIILNSPKQDSTSLKTNCFIVNKNSH